MKLIKSLLILSTALLVRNATAQNYSIDWYKVAGGSGTSSNGQYSLTGTIGQHDAGGPQTGGSYSLTGGFWSLYAVQTPGAPTLYIMKSGNNAVLYWSASVAGYHLESNSSPNNNGGWGAVSGTTNTVGGFNYVTNGITPGNKFYRLRSP